MKASIIYRFKKKYGSHRFVTELIRRSRSLQFSVDPLISDYTCVCTLHQGIYYHKFLQ